MSDLPTDEPPDDYFRLGSTTLYQPDPVLQVRLVGGVRRLAAYIDALAWTGSQFFRLAGPTFGALGILLVVGVKPGEQTRLWCEQVGGELPPDVWQSLVELWEGAGAGTRPQVREPIAFALQCLVGEGPATPIPRVPTAWKQAVADAGRPDGVDIPDGLFRLVCPD